MSPKIAARSPKPTECMNGCPSTMKLRIEKVGGEYFLDAVENNSIKNIAVFKNYDDALRARDALLAKPPCCNRPP